MRRTDLKASLNTLNMKVTYLSTIIILSKLLVANEHAPG